MGNIKYNPEVMVKGILGMRLCVPDDWTDEQIIQFAERRTRQGRQMDGTLPKKVTLL